MQSYEVHTKEYKGAARTDNKLLQTNIPWTHKQRFLKKMLSASWQEV
jgi:hypothetical protein